MVSFVGRFTRIGASRGSVASARRLLSSGIAPRSVSIGLVAVPVHPAQHPELVGRPNTRMLAESPETLGTLQWLMQKQVLNQDAMLLGESVPHLRAIALRFCELTNRESEVVSISRDTTESDLKQRREISGGEVTYSDQPVVQVQQNAHTHKHMYMH